MECVICGLAPCDLPDEVDPEFVFERGDDGQWRCQPHIDTPDGALETERAAARWMWGAA